MEKPQKNNCKNCPVYCLAVNNEEIYPERLDDYAAMANELNASLTAREIEDEVMGLQAPDRSGLYESLNNVDDLRTEIAATMVVSGQIIATAEAGLCTKMASPKSSSDKVFDLCGATSESLRSESFVRDVDELVFSTGAYPLVKMYYRYLRLRRR